MKVTVKEYIEDTHELSCIVDAGSEFSGSVIIVDPFSGHAVENTGYDFRLVGRSMIDKVYEMSDYEIEKDTYYPKVFKEIEQTATDGLTISQKTMDSMRYLFSITKQDEEEALIFLLARFEKEIKSELNEFISDIAKLLGEDDLGKDGKSWSIDDFKDAIQRSGKTAIKDHEIQKELDEKNSMGKCGQCEGPESKVMLKIHGGVCSPCHNENRIKTKRINELITEGHKDHCAKRIVWGDGECECKHK